MSPQSSVAFHPAVIIVVLRWYASNKLMFGAMPRKIPGVWGQSPQGAWGRIRKLSDFRIGSLAFPLDGRSSPPPLAPPAKALGEQGGQAVMSSSLFANIKLKSRFLWVGTILTRVAMGFDGVSESSSGYNRPVDYEHEHEHDYGHGQAEGPERSDADEGLAGRG